MSSSAKPSTSRRSDSSSYDSSLNCRDSDSDESIRSIDVLQSVPQHDPTSVDQRSRRKRSADVKIDERGKRRRKSTPTEDLQPTDSDSDDAEEGTYVSRGLKDNLHGTVYQLKHLMLIVHRAWKMKFSFRLATEMEIAEKFDDVVLRYTDDKGAKVHRFVQAKHLQDETKVINASDLLNVRDGNFSLLKYFNSWRKIKNHPEFCGSELKDFILCTNCGLDAKKLEKKGIDLVSQTDQTDKFLHVTSREKQPPRYKLSVKNPSPLWNTLKSKANQVTDDEISDFLKVFALAVNQPDEVELGEIIELEIGSEFNRLDAGIVRDSFQIYILDWFKKKGGKFLTSKDAKKFFQEMKGKLSSIKTMVVGLDHKEKLEEFGIWFHNEIEELENFIYSRNDSSKRMLEMISSEQTLLTAVRVFQTLTKTRKRGNEEIFTIVRLETLLRKKIMKLVLCAFEWSADNNLLVVDCESLSAQKYLRKLWIPLSKIIAKKNRKRIIVITQKGIDLESEWNHCRKTYLVKDTDYSFRNLTNDSQKKLLGKQVTKFQGRNNETSFGTLLGINDCDNLTEEELDDLSKIMNSATLVQLISDEGIQIGVDMKGLAEIQHYYIHRTICRHVVIKGDILKDDKIPDLFAISGKDRLLTAEPLQMKRKNFIILDSNRDEEQFDALCAENEDRNVHWVLCKQDLLNKEKYVWQKSRGNITSLVGYRDATEGNDNHDRKCATSVRTHACVSEAALASYNEPVIISDTAGMGKSTMLTSLALNLKGNEPNVLVLKLDLNDHADALKNEVKDSDYDLAKIRGAIQFLVEKLLSGETDLARKVYERIIKRKNKVALIFDGFDEICPDYEKTVIDLLETLAKYGIKKIFVASRPHTRETLETKLHTFSHEMKPFSTNNQERFLTDYWKAKFKNSDENRIKKYVTAVVKKLVDSINDIGNKLTSNPLQTYLVAEIFGDYQEGEQETFDSCKQFIDYEIDEPRFPERINLIYLYEHFMGKKFDVVFKRTGADFEKVDANRVRNTCFKKFEEIHQRLALYALFGHGSRKLTDDDVVERDGIVTRFIDDQPQFAHRTYAEYFAAKAFIEMLKSGKQDESLGKIFIVDVLLKYNYATLRVFMDWLLSKTRDAVLNGEFWRRYLKTLRSQWEETIFHVAAAEGHGHIIRLFMNCISSDTEDRRVLVHVKDFIGQTAVHRAVEYGHIDNIKLIIEGSDFDINSRTDNDLTPLHLAAREGKLDVVECLVGKGANINSQDKNNWTPLCFAAEDGKLDVVKYLVGKEANINSQDKNNWSALYSAASTGKLDVVEYLVGKGANINSQNKYGQSPLYFAAGNGKLDVVKYLVCKGANINFQDQNNSTPLHNAAAKEGKLDVIEYLVGNGANINSQDKNDWTPLHFASENRKFEVVEYLVDKGANINSQDKYGRSPLYLAVGTGNLDVVKYLVGKGANINTPDKSDQSPLHFAANAGK